MFKGDDKVVGGKTQCGEHGAGGGEHGAEGGTWAVEGGLGGLGGGNGKRGGSSGWSSAALFDGLLRREMRLESPKPGSGNPHFLDNKNVDLCCYNQSFQRQNPCNVIALTLKIQRQRQTDLFPPDYRFCHFVYIWLAAVLALLQIGKFAFSTHSDQGSRRLPATLLLFCPPPRR